MSKYNNGDFIEGSRKWLEEVACMLRSQGETVGSEINIAGSPIILCKIDSQWVYTNNSNNLTYNHLKNDITESIVSALKSPKLPFKLRNGSLPEVRQWLKDQGYKYAWEGADIFTFHIDCPFMQVREGGIICHYVGEDYFDQKESFESCKYPELTLNFSVKGFTLQPSVNKELEELEKTYEELGEKIKALKVKQQEGVK